MRKRSTGLTEKQSSEILKVLEARFNHNMGRHKGLQWKKVEAKLLANPQALKTLAEMENTGGEPDVIGTDGKKFVFCDCSPETPKGRRSLCYDGAALRARKEHKPKGSAQELADAMGVELLSEEEYRNLQALGEFDTKSSSWLKTPPEIRQLGGALFGDRRYDHVFIYHNGAESYYSVRGFRGIFRV